MNAHILYVHRHYTNGAEHVSVAGVYTSAKKASDAQQQLFIAYSEDPATVDSHLALYSHLYPVVASDVVYDNHDRVGFYIEKLPMNQLPL